MSKHVLSKSTFIRGQQCQKSLYLHYKRPFLRDKISAEQLAKFKRGTDVGVLARDLFPGGQDMSPKSPSQYQMKREETMTALENPEINIIYEAVFQFDDVLIMLDILVRDADGWKAYEVKSSLSISDTYMKDASLQFYVIQGCNVKLSDFFLIYMNENYVLNDTLVLEELFIQKSVLDEVKTKTEEVRHQIQLSKQSLQLTKSPEISIGIYCHHPYPCDFIGHCWKNVPSKSILNLNSFNEAQLFDLYHKGISEIKDFPEHLIHTPHQKAELEAFKKSTLQYDAIALKQFLKNYSISTKYVCLKIIVHQPAVPQIKNTRPYDMLPLAISVLKNDGSGNENILFKQDTSGIINFLEFISKLYAEFDFLITDDANIILQCLSGLEFYINDNFDLNQHEIQNKLIGLKQLVEECMIYHPDFSNGWNLSDIVSVLSEKETALKENVFLVKDLLAESEPEKHDLVFQKLNQYTKAIDLVFNYFYQIT